MFLRLRASRDNHDLAVTDLQHASQLYREWVEDEGYGSSRLNRLSGDIYIIVNGRKKTIARVSYNGRVWKTEADGGERIL